MGYNMANVVIFFLRDAGKQRFSTHMKQLSLKTNNLLRQVFWDCTDFCVGVKWHGHLGRVSSRTGSPCHRLTQNFLQSQYFLGGVFVPKLSFFSKKSQTASTYPTSKWHFPQQKLDIDDRL